MLDDNKKTLNSWACANRSSWSALSEWTGVSVDPCQHHALSTSWTWRSADFEERCSQCAACRPREHGTREQHLTDSNPAPPWTHPHRPAFQFRVGIHVTSNRLFVCIKQRESTSGFVETYHNWLRTGISDGVKVFARQSAVPSWHMSASH